jgi:Protein of unknown function (DUF3703)
MNTPLQRNRRILAAVQAEIERSRQADELGDVAGAFRHLERAHVLGQTVTTTHLRVHWLMLRWGLKQRDWREIAGQVLRLVGAAALTPIGWLPHGNTGGANVGALRPMPIPADLQRQIDATR